MMVNDPIFFPFETDLPPADQALDALYEAFSSYSGTAELMCRSCFDEDYQRSVKALTDPRTAAFEVFRRLFFEHPSCAGPNRTMSFLPRAIEAGYWDDCEIQRRISMTNVWGWPEGQQAALRTVLSVAAVGWFKTGDPAPLLGPPPCVLCGKNCPEQIIVGEELLQGLFLLRVDPFSLFPWLANLDTPRAAMAIAGSHPNGACIDVEPYSWPLEDARETLVAAAEAMNERIMLAACEAVSVEMIAERAVRYAESHPEIAKLYSETLPMDAEWRVVRDDAALAEGLKTIVAGIAAAKRLAAENG